MREVGVTFSSLVLEVAALREAARSGLDSLQEEHSRLEENIRQAQQRHQTVRGHLSSASFVSLQPTSCSCFILLVLLFLRE